VTKQIFHDNNLGLKLKKGVMIASLELKEIKEIQEERRDINFGYGRLNDWDEMVQ